MKFGTLLAACCGLALFASTPAPAASPEWPSKPIRVIVGFAAGTPPDVFARMYGEYATKNLGVPFVIENKPGSAGNLAGAAVAQSPADGYTILYNVSTAFTINPSIYGKLPFQPEKDLVPVSTTMSQGLVLISGPQFPAKSLRALLDQAKARPGAISHASYGAGSPSHLVMEWLKDETGTNMLHVPYRTSPIPDLMGGQVDVVLEPMASAYPLIAAGKVKPLAYSGPQRHPALPDTPTFAEVVPDLAMMSWHGFWAPAATPPAVLERLHAAMLAASQDAGLQRRIRDLNSEPLGVSRADMAAMVQRDAQIYGRIAKTRNIRVD